MLDTTFSTAKILIIDDQIANVDLLKGMLKHTEYHDVTATTDSREACALYEQIQPDLVLLDLMMPHIDGFALLQQLRQVRSEEIPTPIIVLTADSSVTAKRKALAMGAQDFLTKPLDTVEVILRVRNTLQVYFTQMYMRNHNEILQEQVLARTTDLERARLEILLRLARACEYRDDLTRQHTQRVGELAAQIAHTMSIPPDIVNLIRQAAPLHDIGKVGIPDSILLKPTALTEEEFALIQTHTTIGARILEGSAVPVLRLGEVIALTHHERWDGTGYPRRLKGTDIPVVGQIVAAADVFDVITHARPYKRAESRLVALAEIKNQSGAQFNPDVVTALLKIKEGDPTL
jgi:putative two-component system response regulator